MFLFYTPHFFFTVTFNVMTPVSGFLLIFDKEIPDFAPVKLVEIFPDSPSLVTLDLPGKGSPASPSFQSSGSSRLCLPSACINNKAGDPTPF